MARKKLGEGKELVVETDEGTPLRVTLPEDPVDHTIPQADADGGIPEFVNISSKIHLLTVPRNPDGTMAVQRFGIVRGAQWRSLTKKLKRRLWNENPWFVERERGKNGEFDGKYLLTEEQMIDEINKIIRMKRLDELIKNAVLTEKEPDPVPAAPESILTRETEDRPSVMKAYMDRRMWIQERDEQRRAAHGVSEQFA
jgi:hypothetical protein